MAKNQRLPQHAVRVPSYAELERYVRAFADGHLNLLMVFGNPGVGKSRSVRQALAGPVCWIGGQATAFGIFLEAYRHRNQPIVLDDIDALHADRNGVRLLKALCQTEKTKTLSWLTNASALGSRGAPRKFTTTSRVMLIGNDWRTCNADVAALEDRGHMLFFEPTALEVHCQAARWFWDQEIFDLVADYLHLIERHSLRTYVHAWELKCAGLDWREAILSRCLRGAALEVAKLKANATFASEVERIRAFVHSGAGCRATYFLHAKKLKPSQDKPKIPLLHTSPPADSVAEPNYFDRLRQRFGELGNG
jgi:hypothetical protein